jgi:hypothetical protein
LYAAGLVDRFGRRTPPAVIPVITTIGRRSVMTEKTGLFRRREAFEKLMVAASVEATSACHTERA